MPTRSTSTDITPLPQPAPRPAHFLPAVVLILLAATLIRTLNLAAASLWSDEHLTLIRSQSSLADMFDNLSMHGTQVPLYFFFMNFLPVDNVLLLRVPAMLTAVLSIALFIMIVYRLYGRPNMALWAGALLAFNPYFISLSRQARFYPQYLLLALLSSFFFLLLVHRRRSTFLWIAFILATTGAYLTHYFAIALPPAQYLYMFAVARKDRGFLPKWLASQGLAAVLPLAWFIYQRSQPGSGFSVEWIPDPAWTTPLQTIGNLATGFTGSLDWHFVPALALAVIGLLAAVLPITRRYPKPPLHLYWSFLIVVPLLTVIVYSIEFLPNSIYMDRYFIPLLPGVLLLMLTGWERLERYLPHLTAVAGVVLLLSASLETVAMTRHDEYNMYDWQAAAAFLDEHGQPGDAIVVLSPAFADVLWHYSQADPASEHYLPASEYAEEEFVQQLDWHIARASADRGLNTRRVWVFYRNPNINPHRTLVQPDWDPFEPSRFAEADSAMYEWLQARQAELSHHEEFNGVQVLIFPYEAPAGPPPSS